MVVEAYTQCFFGGALLGPTPLARQLNRQTYSGLQSGELPIALGGCCQVVANVCGLAKREKVIVLKIGRKGGGTFEIWNYLRGNGKWLDLFFDVARSILRKQWVHSTKQVVE